MLDKSPNDPAKHAGVTSVATGETMRVLDGLIALVHSKFVNDGSMTVDGVLSHHDGGPNAPDVQTFTASGTWVKPAWATATSLVRVVMLGGGGGGGSGRRGTSITLRCGGGGGGGGGLVQVNLMAGGLPDTVAVTVGAAGTGGAAAAGSDTDGNDGTDGTATSFGSYLSAHPGLGGAGGTAVAQTAVSGGAGTANGASGGTSANTPVNPTGSGAGQGGGAGGHLTTSNVTNDGMTNAAETVFDVSHGTGGVVNSTQPTAGTWVPYGVVGGGGAGAGGASSASGLTQAGSNAGRYGSGGGGGGASVNTQTATAGGAGSPGIAQIITFG